MSIHPNASDVTSIVGICYDVECLAQAQNLAQQLDYPLLPQSPAVLSTDNFVLHVTTQGICLQATGKKAAGPIMVDFVAGENAHRRQFGGGKGQMIAKAVGVKGASRPAVLDITAGLGQDGFVLATLGCHVTLIERSAIVHTLLNDGLERAHLSQDPEVQHVLSRMCCHYAQSSEYLQGLTDPVDVIYFDPMFPERTSKAAVNKSMKAFHTLVGRDDDAGKVLALALASAQYRVVVKRPRKAPAIHTQYPELALPAPNLVFEGKSTRFDVYTFKKIP
ncbi:class I SAM-dependent methyltransferase [Eionea flava]